MDIIECNCKQSNNTHLSPAPNTHHINRALFTLLWIEQIKIAYNFIIEVLHQLMCMLARISDYHSGFLGH